MDLPRSYDRDSALADVRRASGGLQQGFSGAGQEAADNLIDKALRRLDQGDQEAARRFVERALRLPDDDYEQMHPCLWMAHMRLFTELCDDAEVCPEGDSSWLDRAAAVLAAAGPAAAQELRFCLGAVHESYPLSHSETRRVRALAGEVPFDADPFTGVDAPDQPGPSWRSWPRCCTTSGSSTRSRRDCSGRPRCR